ncbi:hypothetical protein J6590_039189 [Homalodisca vitripennis]|nr:hypothetical protein J6590_039189 [Homalodisca vitripennis]
MTTRQQSQQPESPNTCNKDTVSIHSNTWVCPSTCDALSETRVSEHPLWRCKHLERLIYTLRNLSVRTSAPTAQLAYSQIPRVSNTCNGDFAYSQKPESRTPATTAQLEYSQKPRVSNTCNGDFAYSQKPRVSNTCNGDFAYSQKPES